jgi:hypothetical protein
MSFNSATVLEDKSSLVFGAAFAGASAFTAARLAAAGLAAAFGAAFLAPEQ